MTVKPPDAEDGLPVIPVIDVGGGDALTILDAAPERLLEITEAARRRYGGTVLHVADRVSRRWLETAGNPYLPEISAIAGRIDGPGAYMLNLSYEWTCTTGVDADPSGEGSRMLRTLDWPLDGLGRNLVVARHDAAAGDYYSVTWPGFSGITTAMAPGRFGAAVNQPPMRRTYPLAFIDWVVNRLDVWDNRGLPPVHLLRRAFETCRTYAEAKKLLCEAQICLPAFFTLSGTAADEGCVIERLESRAAVREGPASAANHWMAFSVPGRARSHDSPGRWRLMEQRRATAVDGFDWVASPIRNPATRVAAVINAAAGRLMVQGWEKDGPSTRVLTLEAAA